VNRKHLQRFLALSLGVCVFGALLAGCSEGQPIAQPVSREPFPPAPEIETFYRKAGGEDVLGALISPRLEEGNYVYQYAVNALLFCERKIDGDREVRFAPIGLDLNLSSSQLLAKNGEPQSGSNSFPVYQEFIPLYDRLGGGGRIGAPLSGLRYNPRQKRYEQFFEGVGMYRAESDPPGKVKLLAYGAWKCGNACLYPVLPQAEVIAPMPIDSRVLPLVERLGLDFTGFAISPAIKDPDGRLIVIFENVVIEIRPESEGGVSLLPLPQKLGILPQGMVANQEDETKTFLSLDGDKGHHILRSFMNYIDSHGGLDLIGLPIGEPIEWERGSIRQCFEKVCLIEDRQIEGMYRIRPSPLGFEYASLYFDSERGWLSVTPAPVQPSATESSPANEGLYPEVTLEIIETKPFVDSQSSQEIGIIVRFGSQAAGGIIPTLYLSFPDGESYEFEMPPTNEQGKSFIVIPPTQAPNGTLVTYRICIPTPSGIQMCAREDYLIWSP
jgi:hypothetical protein